jgi:hypothetical protein
VKTAVGKFDPSPTRMVWAPPAATGIVIEQVNPPVAFVLPEQRIVDPFQKAE